MWNSVRILVLISVGAVAGVVYTTLTLDRDRLPIATIDHSDPPSQAKAGDRIALMEQEIDLLKARIATLEALPSAPPEMQRELQLGAQPEETSFSAPSNLASVTALPVIDGLVAAGIDPVTAEEIVRAESRVQLQRLELRDSAMREGYIGSERYREEMRELQTSRVSIRQEVGEEAYDKYLYHTGQANRIQVESVILGSAAEDTGLNRGDIILRYEDENLFSWNDLQGATTGGERGELVNITVSRNGSNIAMTIPRGPLGVQLNPVRKDPDDQGG